MVERLKDFIKLFTKTCLVAFLVFYLSFHLINGENGLINYVKKQNELEEIDKQLAITKSKRDALHNKVNRMYSHSLDKDLLDEQYRRATGKIGENELIYYFE
jgi:cell division protein FtsB